MTVLVDKKRAQEILDALDALTERQRDCWKDHFVRGMSYAKISAVRGISKSTVKGHVDRANQRIHEELGRL